MSFELDGLEICNATLPSTDPTAKPAVEIRKAESLI